MNTDGWQKTEKSFYGPVPFQAYGFSSTEETLHVVAPPLTVYPKWSQNMISLWWLAAVTGYSPAPSKLSLYFICYVMLLNRVKRHDWQLSPTCDWDRRMYDGNSILQLLSIHRVSPAQDGSTPVQDMLVLIYIIYVYIYLYIYIYLWSPFIQLCFCCKLSSICRFWQDCCLRWPNIMSVVN